MLPLSWKLRRLLVWDVPCVNVLAPSHRLGSANCAGTVAATEEADGANIIST